MTSCGVGQSGGKVEFPALMNVVEAIGFAVFMTRR
jgi:hypothetical protein